MANKRVSFEQKIKEIVDKGERIDIYRVDEIDKYIVSRSNNDGSKLEISNDLGRALTNLYNNL